MYDRLLAGSKVVTPKIESGNWSIYNQYVVRVPDRDRVKKVLQEKGIGSAIYYPLPLHLQECFGYLGCRAGISPERAGLQRGAGAAGLSRTAGRAGALRCAGIAGGGWVETAM